MKIVDGDLVGLVATDFEDGALVEKRKFVLRVRLENGTFVDVPALNTGQEKKVSNQTKKFKKIKEDVEEEPDIDEDIDEEEPEEVPDIDEEDGSFI